jgi:FkbH-like protein
MNTMNFLTKTTSCDLAKVAVFLDKYRTRKPLASDLLEVKGIGAIPVSWEEHCQECDAPRCYQTCALYEPETNVGCRRFEFGIVLNEDNQTWTGCHADLIFKRWGRLKAKSRNLGYLDPWPYGFLLQLDFDCDPNISTQVILDIAPSPWTPEVPRISKTLRLSNGYNQVYVSPIELQVLRNFYGAEASLCFIDNPCGVIRLFAAHFVEGVTDNFGQNIIPKKMICIDLDKTIWNGILGETSTKPKPITGLAQLLNSLKNHRLSLIVVSRSSDKQAIDYLKEIEIYSFFDLICCNITSKSETITKLCTEFNVFPHEVIFVDDAFYERAEVEALCPGVIVIPETRLLGLADDPLITGSSTTIDWHKQSKKEQGLNLEKFRRQLESKIIFANPLNEDLVRCWELLQRTNRLHCVEWRPTFATFLELIKDKNTRCRIGQCSDHSGDYGLVCLGIAVIEGVIANVISLTFSCRIADREFPLSFTQEFRNYLLQEVEQVNIIHKPSAYANSSVKEIRKILTGTVPEKNFSDVTIVNSIEFGN